MKNDYELQNLRAENLVLKLNYEKLKEEHSSLLFVIKKLKIDINKLEEIYGNNTCE